MTLTFSVFGVAQAKGSMRAIHVRGMRHPIVTDSNRSAKSWSQLVAQAASATLDKMPREDCDLLADGVRLTIGFFLPRPQKHSKRGVFVPHTVKPDLDKLTRAILDALTFVLYHDDKQVTEVIAGKYYADVDAPARVDIRVEPAPDRRIVETPRLRAVPLFDEVAP